MQIGGYIYIFFFLDSALSRIEEIKKIEKDLTVFLCQITFFVTGPTKYIVKDVQNSIVQFSIALVLSLQIVFSFEPSCFTESK